MSVAERKRMPKSMADRRLETELARAKEVQRKNEVSDQKKMNQQQSEYDGEDEREQLRQLEERMARQREQEVQAAEVKLLTGW